VRPAYPWTPTVHALLLHLTASGFDAVPRPIGIADGMETLTFIPGELGVAGWAKIVPEEGLRAFARFLRRYHDASVGFALPSPSAARGFEPQRTWVRRGTLDDLKARVQWSVSTDPCSSDSDQMPDSTGMRFFFAAA
jgi:hypothetical protein